MVKILLVSQKAPPPRKNTKNIGHLQRNPDMETRSPSVTHQCSVRCLRSAPICSTKPLQWGLGSDVLPAFAVCTKALLWGLCRYLLASSMCFTRALRWGPGSYVPCHAATLWLRVPGGGSQSLKLSCSRSGVTAHSHTPPPSPQKKPGGDGVQSGGDVMHAWAIMPRGLSPVGG